MYNSLIGIIELSLDEWRHSPTSWRLSYRKQSDFKVSAGNLISMKLTDSLEFK